MSATSGSRLQGPCRLSEPEIVRLFDPKIFARGVACFSEGRLKQRMAYRGSLTADCRGTLPEDYHISIGLREGNFIASCTCPYAFGYCKHIAATLYAWVKRPAMFEGIGQSEDRLKSPAELMLADYRHSSLADTPGHSEERDYVDERLCGLGELISASAMAGDG